MVPKPSTAAAPAILLIIRRAGAALGRCGGAGVEA